jgi:GT2 family glycosyltransferase
MQKVNSPDLSIIILSYKSKDHLAVLLPSVLGSEEVEFVGNGLQPFQNQDFGINGGLQTRPYSMDGKNYTAELIVVDNDSRDGTAEWLMETDFLGREKSSPLTLIRNVNNGFSKGNNLGIRQSSGRYVLLLNPDTKLEPNTLKTMLNFMESHPEVGMSGCKLIKADGSLDLACRRRFPNPVNSFRRLFLGDNTNYNYSDIDENQEMEVDAIVGAFMLVRRSVIDKIGLLDEDFFMYGEDLDWCWRCKEAGFKVWYYPKTFIHHYKGESSKKARLKTIKAFHNAMWIFYRKHYYKKYSLPFNWLVWLGIYARMLVLAVINLL